MSNDFVVFDGHNDTLLNLYQSERGFGRNFFERSTPEKGHIDLPRAKESGFGGGIFAIFCPSQAKANTFDNYKTANGYALPTPPPLDRSSAVETVMDMMALLFRLERESEGAIKVTRTVDEIEHCIQNDILAMCLHFEGAEAIDTDFNALEVFYQAGLRSLGIVWSRPTAFAHGVPLRYPADPDIGPGLTDAGKALVKACNDLGIMLDLSHLNEKGFWDVVNLSDAPIVATHSNVHRLCNMPRNLTDKQLDAIKASNGMVGLNFAVGFLREDGKWDANTPLETMVRHIDYLVEHVGIDCVGFGSDYDGAKIPTEIADVTGLPKLIDALKQSGYDDDSLRKITHQNWLRVLRQTWKD